MSFCRQNAKTFSALQTDMVRLMCVSLDQLREEKQTLRVISIFW